MFPISEKVFVKLIFNNKNKPNNWTIIIINNIDKYLPRQGTQKKSELQMGIALPLSHGNSW